MARKYCHIFFATLIWPQKIINCCLVEGELEIEKSRIFFLDCCLTLKEAGGGPKVPSGFSIGCHFSQDHAMVTKILDFIHIHPK